MAVEKKQRGRRAEKAQKESHEDEEYHDKVYSGAEDEYKYATGSNAFSFGGQDNENGDREGDQDQYSGYGGRDREDFFGLLDEQETEYFKQAESTLAVDAFGSPEERRGFVSSVFEEVRGKELKLVTSYVGSRLGERLVLLASKDVQLVGLMRALSGNFGVLVKNKFASHVVETLVGRAAPLIEREMLDPEFLNEVEGAQDEYGNDGGHSTSNEKVSLEKLFLNMVDEIVPIVNSLPDHPYGSHFLRLLLLILAGKPIPAATEAKSALRSRKSKDARKKIILTGTQTVEEEKQGENNDSKQNDSQAGLERTYQVPKSFATALNSILSALIQGLDTTSAREMSIHAVSSPVVQLVLGIECDRIADSNPNPQKIKIPTDTLLSLLFPYSTNRQKKLDKAEGKRDKSDKSEDGGKESKKSEEAYVEYLLSDAVGSHLLEAVIDILPVKLTTRLADRYMVGRIGKLVRRQQSGNYVVQALLRRLSGRKDVASKIMDELIEEIKNGNPLDADTKEDEDKKESTSGNDNFNFGLANTAIQVSQQSLSGYKTDDIVNTIVNKYDPKKEGVLLTNMLGLGSSSKGKKNDKNSREEDANEQKGSKMQKALLLQTLVSVSPSTTNLILENLINLGDNSTEGNPNQAYLTLGRDSILSHVFQKSLVVTTDSANMVLRRRLLNHLSRPEVCAELAANVYGSHVVDSLWAFCFRLKFFRERVAEALVARESEIKMTGYGRSVWKNWKLDDYLRRRRDWWTKVKDQEDGMSEVLGVQKKDSRDQGPKPKPVRTERRDPKSGKAKREGFNKQKREKVY